jgi:hypothetical protein
MNPRRLGLAIATATVFALLTASAAFAQTTTSETWRRHHRYNINQRQENQQDRIGEGIENGSLTANEAARLEREEVRFSRIEARDRASGGGLSRQERRQLDRDQNRLSRDIYRQRHDRQHQ